MTRWRATELERTTETTTYPPKPAELATVGDRRLVVAGTEVVLLDRGGVPVWRHDCAATPNTAHVSEDRLLVLTDSLDYDNTWGILGPALLLDLGTGTLVTTWHSYGHYVVDADGVRVVECDGIRPTRAAVVRLLPDGTIVVLDGGRLLAVGPDLRGRDLATVHPDPETATTMLGWRVEDSPLTVAFVSGGTTHRIRYALTTPPRRLGAAARGRPVF